MMINAEMFCEQYLKDKDQVGVIKVANAFEREIAKLKRKIKSDIDDIVEICSPNLYL